MSHWSSEEAAYHELCGYTLTHGDPRFIHQHVVDTHAAQTPLPGEKPIRLVFALVGLYLHLERGRTGREAQLAHMQMAKRKREWPQLPRPHDCGVMTAIDVMQHAPGPERDAAIDQWCASVWSAYAAVRPQIISLLAEYRLD